MPHLTPFSLLGGGTAERETLGQVLATQVASAIATKNQEERRIVVLGLGLREKTLGPDEFYGIVDLVLRCV